MRKQYVYVVFLFIILGIANTLAFELNTTDSNIPDGYSVQTIETDATIASIKIRPSKNGDKAIIRFQLTGTDEKVYKIGIELEDTEAPNGLYDATGYATSPEDNIHSDPENGYLEYYYELEGTSDNVVLTIQKTNIWQDLDGLMLLISDAEAGAEAPIVLPGEDPEVVTLPVGFRFRSFGNTGGDEIYVGGPDLGNGSHRIATQFTWSSPGTHEFEFSFNPATGYITLDLEGTVLSKGGYTGEGWNYMQIEVVNRGTGTTVNLNDVVMDGYSLGDFEGDGWSTWHISGYDFSDAFELTGEVELDGTFSTSQELCKLQIMVGKAD